MATSPSSLDPHTLARLHGLQLRAKHIVEGYVAGLHRSPYRGFSIEFAEHREYSPGDDLRYVDWKVFGRTDKYYLKQYEDETNLICYLVLDISESMTFRGPAAGLSKLEYAQCLASALAFTASLYAADMQVGTWKINLAKSKYDPAALAPKSTTVKGEAVDNGIKTVVDTVDSQGKSFHYEYTAKYDGKDYPVKGDPNRDSTALKKIDDYTFDQINKKGGKITTTNRTVYARDGKSRTQTGTGTNAQGQKVHNVVVWEKQ